VKLTRMSCSLVEKAVGGWRADLKAKNRSNIAASIAHPGENPELFEEGWQDATAREAGLRAQLLRQLANLVVDNLC
jgi:hypothetical protein